MFSKAAVSAAGISENSAGRKTSETWGKARPERVITPVNSAHRLVLMAIERGKLQNFIFENQALFSHRAMAAILNVVLRLPPVKRALAGRQLKSRYVEHLVMWYTRKYETNARQERVAPESLLTGS